VLPRLFPDKPIKTPALDKLADQGKMATLPHARTPASIVSSAGGANRPADPDAAKKWFDGWEQRQQDREEAKRDPEVVSEEKRLGLPSLKHLRTGKPQGQWEETKIGIEEGFTRIGQTAAGLGSMVGVPGSETRRKMYADRAETLKSFRRRDAPKEGLSGGDIANGVITQIPEWINPLSKPGQVTKVGNAVYHAGRSYAPDKSLADAAVGASSNVVGEKAEDLLTRGKGLVGNLVGSLTEKGANYLRDASQFIASPRQNQTVDSRGKALVKARREKFTKKP
jgi:hypothetical protein